LIRLDTAKALMNTISKELTFCRRYLDRVGVPKYRFSVTLFLSAVMLRQSSDLSVRKVELSGQSRSGSGVPTADGAMSAQFVSARGVTIAPGLMSFPRISPHDPASPYGQGGFQSRG
jgi:hypothetical protein